MDKRGAILVVRRAWRGTVWAAIVLAAAMMAGPVRAQNGKGVTGSFAADIRDFVATPTVPGYERALTEKIRDETAALHPAVDNLGDVTITIGSGAPRRLIATPIDEPGYVVSEITDDGYLRLQRLPQSGELPPIFNELYSAQPVRVGTANGKWIDGVVAGLSIHLQNGRMDAPKSSDIDNMYVDIGASSAAEARKAGVDLLSPVAIDRYSAGLSDTEIAGASVGDKFGAAAVMEMLREIDPSRIKGTLTVAFVAQQWVGGRGLERILNTVHADEMIYVGRLLPGGAATGMQGVHRAPRHEPGDGVLLGYQATNGIPAGLATELKQVADANKIPLAIDYSAPIIPASYLPLPAFPAQWVHLGIATAWSNTPSEEIATRDLEDLTGLLTAYATGETPNVPHLAFGSPIAATAAPERPSGAHPSRDSVLAALVETYAASNHEGPMRDAVRQFVGDAKPEQDDAGNLILHLGDAPAGSKTPKILVVAHMDEIGFEVKSISKDGRLEVAELGGMDLSFYEGHPALVHTATGDRDAIMELPPNWDEANFAWPAESEQAIRVDVGARTPEEVAKLGIKVGDSITIPKEYRKLLGTRANGRSFDDRVGDAALISAVVALGNSLKDRDVTFVWSTGEELGLDGAEAVAKRLAAAGRTPDYVFAVDTFVSSDSPLESKRFADAPIGKGFVIRAIDSSNIAPRDAVERVIRLARENQIPVQYGVTSGGNDGATFVPHGAVGWPLRYSHSPAEVIDTRDVDALARIIEAIAKSW
ncbi:MAG TPA: M20/M25/M40 family metallo-hydrolase [Candidatus Acidoferrales bacterium]|jgi:putative aminopeptidase FrvX|nr:M20/M25/M40 family metallo-hydrolase [Candidatus Acidoferrales bacterium]